MLTSSRRLTISKMIGLYWKRKSSQAIGMLGTTKLGFTAQWTCAPLHGVRAADAVEPGGDGREPAAGARYC